MIPTTRHTAEEPNTVVPAHMLERVVPVVAAVMAPHHHHLLHLPTQPNPSITAVMEALPQLPTLFAG